MPTACLCWRWRTWWSWVISPTPNVSSPTYSLWSTTCADTRCPWVGPATSDLCSVKHSAPTWHQVPSSLSLHLPWPLLSSIFTWWPPPHGQAGSQGCTSLRWTMRGLHVCVFVCQFAYYLCWQWWCVFIISALVSTRTVSTESTFFQQESAKVFIRLPF